MKFNVPNAEKWEKLELLQRWIIVQSILYYELDFNLVTDKAFDENCKQLVEAMNLFPKALKKTSYYYCMKDFDGSTGYDLYGRLNKKDKDYLYHIASYLKFTFSKLDTKRQAIK